MVIEFLKGKWLKHPLHPIFAHLPIGLWPAALLFDLISQGRNGGNTVVQLSFYCIALGLLATVLAVPTGIVDWSEIKKEKPAWKLGLYHMALNLVAIVLSAANLGLRFSTFRESLRVGKMPLALSALAVLVVAISGYLGGLMIYDHGISVARFSKAKWRRIAEAGGANLPAEKGGQA
jgi:uncharacterized membrane protein